MPYLASTMFATGQVSLHCTTTWPAAVVITFSSDSFHVELIEVVTALRHRYIHSMSHHPMSHSCDLEGHSEAALY
jgi:hypothetical protein